MWHSAGFASHRRAEDECGALRRLWQQLAPKVYVKMKPLSIKNNHQSL